MVTGSGFVTSLQNVWLGFISFVPNLLVAILVFILAWVIGSLIGRLIKEALFAIKLDKFLGSVGLDDVAQKAGVRFSPSAFLGNVVRWFVIIVGLIVALDAVGLRELNTILRSIVVDFLPKVVIASIVLIAAAYLSRFVSKAVSASAKSVDVKHSNLLATIAKYAIWAFAFIIALAQLGIGGQFLQILFVGVVFMLSLAGGLAFGLGGRDFATRAIAKVEKDISKE